MFKLVGQCKIDNMKYPKKKKKSGGRKMNVKSLKRRPNDDMLIQSWFTQVVQSAVMSLPLGRAFYSKLSIAIMCKMKNSTRSSVWETMKPDTQRHWQTLLNSVHTTRSPQTWACLAAGTRRRPSDVCQLSWNVPTEYTLQHHYQHPCPHLVYLGTFWVWWEKWPIANDKSSARQHIYTS